MARKLTSSMKWQQFAVVEASSPFGILDHMRYDRACPFTEHDAVLLENYLMHYHGNRQIRFVIVRWSEDKKSLWSEYRWNTGGVRITPCDEETAINTKRETIVR